MEFYLVVELITNMLQKFGNDIGLSANKLSVAKALKRTI
jgi:hypothetical protein